MVTKDKNPIIQNKKIKKMKTIKQFFDERAEAGSYQEYKEGDRNLKIIKSLERNKAVLSLGCGAGREIRELKKITYPEYIIAIDISEKMIEKSKKIEPKIKHYCMDAVEFAEKNKTKFNFDYILGLYSFLNYIKKEDRAELIKNLHNMLNEGGEIIFELRMWNDRWQDIVKCIYYYLTGKAKEFGDIMQTHTNRHHFTKNQLKELFKNYNYEIKGNVVRCRIHVQPA